FYMHKSIHAFAEAIVQRHGSPSEQAFLFPSHAVAGRCLKFFRTQESFSDIHNTLRIVDLYPNDREEPSISAVLCQKVHAKIAKTFWQHSGGGISSRRAEYCHKAFEDGRLGVKLPLIRVVDVNPSTEILCKGPKRYQKRQCSEYSLASEQKQRKGSAEGRDYVQFIEERFGRNLDSSMADKAKLAIRRRIAGALTANVDLQEAVQHTHSPTRTAHVEEFSEDDVYLYPCGMNSIFDTHRMMLACRGEMKSISYGFPYIDTLKILEKWGPGCLFYGHGSPWELDDLERRCKDGERFLALFCEFPGNPLLKTPDLRRIRSLADRYDIAVVVDETISNFINVHVLPAADVVVSSLTKVFAGECNVMGGRSLVLNPRSRYYKRLKEVIEADYEDNYWPEDAIFMERNSRDFISRVHRINENAEAICDVMRASPIAETVKEVYYPKYSPTQASYDEFRHKNGGYGGLLSVTFKATAQAITFYNQLDTAKGPSLGTNFTLR
ncbi:MAG: hypothetical protein Q9163_006355, partial [Psora crenata]